MQMTVYKNSFNLCLRSTSIGVIIDTTELALLYLIHTGGRSCSRGREEKNKHLLKKIEKRQEGHKLDSHLEEQFASGRLLAAIASRPGQCGRADGYVV